jgi:predicted lipid carrier protein YhbT
VTVESTIAGLVDQFNQHARATPAIAQELKGVSRTIVIRLTDEKSYAIDLKDAQLSQVRAVDGRTEKADLTVTTDTATFEALVARRIGPFAALFSQKLSIAGSLEDKLLLRRLLS